MPVSGVIEGAGGNSQNDDKRTVQKNGQNEGSEESSESLDSFESKSSNEKMKMKRKRRRKNTSKYEYDIKNYIGGETAIEKKIKLKQ